MTRRRLDDGPPVVEFTLALLGLALIRLGRRLRRSTS